ncbi:hypothetical protein CDD81_7644 [Ophiocordyceps australis]|uniref:Phosphogluconate dehydrogenase NAD-binding putative C-terminal domain-containing protein n=1 Tax=Ophiocordyceps australis TaxID=1399860 RepID=A0A2C5Y3M9_9HYPO|nr:hypothetical protein CDD81_7644 [Ophiocordyceps australis]
MQQEQQQEQVVVGILSMGDMGAGIAKLLMAQGMAVVTNCQDRSQETMARAREAGVRVLWSDRALVEECDVVMSIVPPGKAEATADRVAQAAAGSGQCRISFYLDLNAVSPATSGRIEAAMGASGWIRFVDGCIIGGPPRRIDDGGAWWQPSVPISGPHAASLPAALCRALGTRRIEGSASGLKMCFAGLAKGFTALATQTLTTACQLGLGDELAREMEALLPAHWAAVQRGLPDMPPKAYRWVAEMDQIADTMRDNGAWPDDAAATFRGAAAVYRAVASQALPSHQSETRLTATQLAAAMAQRLGP